MNVESLTKLFDQTSVNSEHELSFAGRGLKLDSEKDAKEIVEALNSAQTVHSLHLEGNTLGVEAAKSIAKALERHPELQRARWSDMFTGRLKSEIPQALRYLGGAMMLCEAKLVELDLSDNAFGPNGMEGLTEFLKSSCCYTLRELRLNNNGLGIGGGKMLAKSLLECHRSSMAAGTPLSLKVFISGRNRLENDGATALAEAFTAIGTLEEVSMPQNGINHSGITALAKAFAVNTNLKSINLNDNTFTVEGAKSMAQSLPKLQNLDSINFGDCLVRTEGAIALANSLREGHRTLKELYLGFNEISKAGALAIAESMKNKDELEKIDLDGNQFGEAVDSIRETFENIGKISALGSLSDDEGSNDEDDGEDESDEAGDDQIGKLIKNSRLTVTGKSLSTAVTQPDQEVTAKEFLKLPSRNSLIGMGPKRGQLLLDSIEDGNEDLNRCMDVLMKVCSIVEPTDTEAQQAAFKCADELMSHIFKISNGENSYSVTSNAILEHLGLIKSEDKIKPADDLNGPLIVLNHAVKQRYFPKSVREVLNMFMSVPNKKFHSCMVTRGELLKTLNMM